MAHKQTDRQTNRDRQATTKTTQNTTIKNEKWEYTDKYNSDVSSAM